MKEKIFLFKYRLFYANIFKQKFIQKKKIFHGIRIWSIFQSLFLFFVKKKNIYEYYLKNIDNSFISSFFKIILIKKKPFNQRKFKFFIKKKKNFIIFYRALTINLLFIFIFKSFIFCVCKKFFFLHLNR